MAASVPRPSCPAQTRERKGRCEPYADGLDAWLLYDFHGSNPIASEVTGVGRSGHLATRRWYYLIPATGEPRGLVHAIERQVLAHLPGAVTRYAGREELERGLREQCPSLRVCGCGEADPH